jgi:hypothetical protein
MKITIKNFGVIKHASIDTTRPINVFCGLNSTGKTYLTYLLYYIFSDDSYVGLDDYDSIIEKRESDNSLTFVYNRELLNKFLLFVGKKARKDLPVIFGISDDEADELFKDFSLKLFISEDEFRKQSKFSLKMKAFLNGYNFLFFFNSKEKVVKISKEDTKEISNDDFKKIWNFLLCQAIRRLSCMPSAKSWMLTVERHAIYTFGKEVINSRSQFDDFYFSDDIYTLSEFGPRSYPLAIRRSLKYAKDIDNIKKTKGNYYDLAIALEKELLHGSLETSKSGSIELHLGNNVILPIQVTSSLVKSLANLIICLKYQASFNDIILIDEPEMNLHPANQIFIARIFGELINKGLRLIISTHSDYIIRELNNLVMLSNTSKEYQEGISSMGYRTTMMIKPNMLGAYMFKYENDRVVVDKIDVTKEGFASLSIDDTIDALNENSESIYYAMKYGQQ